MSMSGQYLNTITENASRLGMRIQESFSEHTRDLTIQRNTYLEADDKGKDIRRQLDSNSDREKLDAMKRLIALISKGRNVSEYFAQVVKNVASQNLEIRKLVYIYLLRYAEQEPDLALLSINTFQKDLTDSNPLIRAMALRVLSGIKVPMIGSLVVLAIKKCAADISPYVRKNAAFAIPKCYELDSSHLPALIEILTTLLKDRSALVLGAVAVAFDTVCPTRLDLLHSHYRRLCKVIADVDEWGQVEVVDLLLRYARAMLPRPDGEDLDKDIQLLLSSIESLLLSRNPAVVMAVVRAYYYAAPPSYLAKVVQPLIRLLSNSKEIERVVLVYISFLSRHNPGLFSPFYTRFLVRSDDTRRVKQDKINLLLNVITTETYPGILRELIDYSEDPDDVVVSDAILGIGKCAHTIPESSQQCLTALTAMIKHNHDSVVSSAVMVLKFLVQSQLSASSATIVGAGQNPLSIISHLARRIDDIRHDQARACVLWLVGQYAASEEPGSGPDGVASWAPDVLRKATKGFSQESAIVKLQIVTLAAKLLVLSPADRTLGLLSQYVFSLARYDLNYDVRDRARMLASLLSGLTSNALINGESTEPRAGVVLRREQVKLVLFGGKSADVDLDSGRIDDDNAILGSLSMVSGKPSHSDAMLPDWLERGVESSLRDTVDETPQVPVPTAISSVPMPQISKGAAAVASPIVLTPRGSSPVNAPAKGPWKDLDKFYEDIDKNQGEEEDDDEEEEVEEEEESDDEVESEEGSEEDGSEGGEDDEGESDEEDEGSRLVNAESKAGG